MSCDRGTMPGTAPLLGGAFWRVIFRCEPQFETMSMPLEQLEAEALGLPIRERASLAHRLLESLDEDEDPVETERCPDGHRASQIFGHTDQESTAPSEPAVLDTKARYTPTQG